MSNLGFAVVFAAAAAVAAPSAALADGVPVSSASLAKLAPMDVLAVWKGKYTAEVKLKAGGKVKARSGSFSDKGKWKLKGDEFCVKFRFWTWGKYKCGKVWKMGENSYEGFRRVSGKPRVTFKFK